MRKKNYNIIIKREGEVIKKFHTNDCLYAWKQIKHYYEDESGAEYIDRRDDILQIFGENGEEYDLYKIQEDCWRNGHFVK